MYTVIAFPQLVQLTYLANSGSPMYGATDTLRSYTERERQSGNYLLTGSLARKSPPAPAFTRPCRHGLVGFQLCGRRVVCGLCRASILAGLAGRARVCFAAAIARSLLPVCRDFPVVHPLRFRGLTLQLPPAVCVRLRLPRLRPVHPRLIARLLWRHGTARCRGICEQRRKTSCSMRNLSL